MVVSTVIIVVLVSTTEEVLLDIITVEIKGTVVNKGKQSNTIYKVKEVQ